MIGFGGRLYTCAKVQVFYRTKGVAIKKDAKGNAYLEKYGEGQLTASVGIANPIM